MNDDQLILKKNLDKMIRSAVAASQNGGLEICGLLISNGFFIELVQVNNKIKKGGGFKFYVNEIRFLQKCVDKMDHEIIGTFHSHPEYIDEPSESDVYNAVDNSLMLIIDVTDRKVGLWYIENLAKKRLNYKLI